MGNLEDDIKEAQKNIKHNKTLTKEKKYMCVCVCVCVYIYIYMSVLSASLVAQQ